MMIENETLARLPPARDGLSVRGRYGSRIITSSPGPALEGKKTGSRFIKIENIIGTETR
jgi:hypothetical protein